MTILLQLDKIMKEKEAQFLEEKSNLWKELTDGFQKVRFRFVQSFSFARPSLIMRDYSETSNAVFLMYSWHGGELGGGGGVLV